MTEPVATSATAVAHSQSDDVPHDEHHVHVYPTSGIAEGNAKIPLWFTAVLISLFAFFFCYIALQWGAQPSSAHAK